MQPYEIATADYLDILFEEKNKSYGAYPLRKEYNKRLTVSLLITGGIVAACLAFYYTSKPNHQLNEKTNVPVVTLQQIDDKPEPVEPPPPPPPPPPPAEQIASRAFTTPQIISDENVDPDDAPPPVEELNSTRIGLINQDGADDIGIAPPISDDRGIIEAPVRSGEPEDEIFRKVEIESSYPGGTAAWRRFLLKTFRYPQQAQENNVTGKVIVKFVVDKEGNVSNVEAISGPEELKAEAIRVINKSGRWIPAIQNGSKVKSYKEQLIVFELGEE
jgi:periplasmic protein TonB